MSTELFVVVAALGLCLSMPAALAGYWLCVRFAYQKWEREITYGCHPWMNPDNWPLRRRGVKP